MTSFTSNKNQKSITNLEETPNIIANLFEPVSNSVHTLGSASNPWSDVWVNRIPGYPNFAQITIFPTARINNTSTNSAPPADLAANSNYPYYLQFSSSSNLRVWRYFADNIAAVEIFPPVGATIYAFSATVNQMGIYVRTTSSEWRRVEVRS